MRKTSIIIVLAAILIIVAAIAGVIYFLLKDLPQDDKRQKISEEISSFEECAAAGNPIMESYPRQCAANGQTYTESLKGEMNEEEAREIAQASSCIEEGGLIGNGYYNDNTNTWWFDLDIKREGCSPACAVDVVIKQAEINWRCTGLIRE